MQKVQRAHALRIIGSALYDGLILLGLLMVAGFLAVVLHKLITNEDAIGQALWFQLYLLVVIAAYFIYFWQRSGQTVGMKAWRIKLINLADQPLTVGRLTVRWITAVPAYCCFLLGVLWQYWDKDQLTWHDRLSHTKLVYLPKAKNKASMQNS